MSVMASRLEDGFVALASERIADPRPIYADLREHAPVLRTPMGFWYVTSYELASSIGRADEEWTVSAAAWQTGAHPDNYAFGMMERMILTIDGAEHARLRRLVAPVFHPGRAETLADKVRLSIDRQLAGLSDSGQFDLVSDFATLLPTRVVLDVLGIPDEHVLLFVDVADSLIAMHEPTATEETIDHADAVFQAVGALVVELLHERRARPADDLLTALVQAGGDDDERLTDDELVAMILLLGVAGHETTAHTLVSGVYHLLQDPEALAEVRGDPAIIGSAVEEILRYDAATRNSVARYATRDLTLGDTAIRRGEKLFVGLHAANHDPAQFPDPLVLNVRRKPNRHIAFNVGPHSCLGSALARLELRLALQGLLDRYPTIEMVDRDVVWKRSFIIRGLESLPLLVQR